jgi:hypothetical protein
MTAGMIKRRGTGTFDLSQSQLERPHDVSPGRRSPLGATSVEGGVNLSIFSSQGRNGRSRSLVTLVAEGRGRAMGGGGDQ